MIDRGDIRRAIDRCSNIWATAQALVMVSSSIRLTAWLQNSKRAERSKKIDVWASHRDYLRSGYPHHRSACHGLLMNTVITPLPTKPSATKMPEELKLVNSGSATCRWWRWCCRALMPRRSWLIQAENDALRDDVAAGRRRLRIKAVCRSVREATTASAWIIRPPPTGRHRWTGYFTLRERLITMQKQLEGTEVY